MSQGLDTQPGFKFVTALEEHAPFFASSVRTCVEDHSEPAMWLLNPLADWSEKAFGDDIYTRAAEGYAMFSKDVAQLQRLYEKDGEFNHDGMSRIKEGVYHDPEYMIPYMWAAILIYPFWPSMIRHIAYYRDNFLRALPDNAKVMELGCGHGVLGMMAAQECPTIKVESCDLSEHAIEIAQNLLKQTDLGDRVEQKVLDVLDISNDSPDRFEGIIAAMLAEHLEEPQKLFKSIKHYLAEGGICFFSTALESAQKDHVYEFHTEGEVIQMAEAEGLRVIEMISDGQPRNPFQQFRPRAFAAILEHA